MSPHDRDADLARLLGEAVDDVEPTDRLGEIRARTATPTAGRRWWYAGGAVLAAAAAVTAVAVLGPGNPPVSAPDPVGPAPSGSATPGPAPAPATVATYWLGETPQGPRLYREQTRLTDDGGSRVAAVVRAVVEGRPADPDYRSAWPGFSVDSVDQGEDGGSVDVRMSFAAGAERDVLAVSQLAHTVWDLLGERVPVNVEATGPGGESVNAGVEPYGEDLDLDVLALVSIDDPVEGQEVAATFTARGRASSFEATVPWEVRDATGAVVADGFSTAEGWMDRLHPWTAEVDVSGLAPGRYTFVAMTSDPSDGESGGPFTDTRTIVVP
ncbi:hypothetical protein BKA08_003730 [Nocardioides marinisabuli]|uniref:Bacterial spore germination immunoglobulin-like domain-containing protein n=1 Tax=Nocardioides marinisabuli TaxID=419476 RepID=A0A7Y9F4N8_9ACTN|nr:Gmad2 immunoglobulin-like domain-containing protein [Nocardioides marinisabuli]NYD59492.1 hypothetical protein [Nocardioides marinisabuli]